MSRTWLTALLVLLFALTADGCSPPAVERLFVPRKHVTKEGNIWPYAVFVPGARPPGEKLPVILFLNGWGENGTDGLRQISNNLGGDIWRMRDHFPFLAVCPQCAYNGSWEPGSKNATMALAVLDEAIRDFGGDPDRISISGPSAGGQGALQLALTNPDRFAAVVPVSADIACDPSELGSAGIPVWCFYNGRDVVALVSSVRQSRRLLLQSGLSPLVTEFDEAGHNSWDNAYSSPALYAWLLQQNAKNRGTQRGFTFLKPDELLTSWSTTAPSRWRADGDDIVAAGGEEKHSLLTSPSLQGDFDLHLDVLLGDDGSALALADETGRPLMELAVEAAERGPGTWRDSAGRAIGTLDVVAQRALGRGWNDLRLSRKGRSFQLTLNGWPASELPDPADGAAMKVAFASSKRPKETRWRFVRLREREPRMDRGAAP